MTANQYQLQDLTGPSIQRTSTDTPLNSNYDDDDVVDSDIEAQNSYKYTSQLSLSRRVSTYFLRRLNWKLIIAVIVLLVVAGNVIIGLRNHRMNSDNDESVLSIKDYFKHFKDNAESSRERLAEYVPSYLKIGGEYEGPPSD
ncbi:hypothetical protein DASC09_019840 [Saccharomycopsis crataegensis]|uniref:Uncharacterized protein n=1 Tax=Saccharomycopsis crataegensis TaxID=43959 RepID=A0AAV5QIU1_9ASCO|nr:hypothetical protein DASC09_019840 [Saccharomycopsis crataegensis]